MTTRRASHAGSWYTSSSEPVAFSSSREGCSKSNTSRSSFVPSSAESQHDNELTRWLAAVKSTDEQLLDLPIKGCKAIIAP